LSRTNNELRYGQLIGGPHRPCGSAELPAACQELGIKRPLIVTDPGLAGPPMIGDAPAALKATGLGAAVFSDVKGNPINENLDAWTGVKDSGRGCTLSRVGYEFLTRPKSFHLRTST
jgi:hypothetical protein